MLRKEVLEKIHNEGLRNLYSSLRCNIVGQIKSRTCSTHWRHEKNRYLEKLRRKRPLGRHGYRL